jgi:predicted DNA-binding ArsR family transcriptional regulator
MEIWKDIKDYEGLYQVSNFGRVMGLKRNKILKPRINFGYQIINLWKNNVCKTYRVNRLVAETFIPNPENKPEVNHLNGKDDNRAISLEWCTSIENKHHAWNTGLCKHKGEKHYLTSLTENDVKEIREKYIPRKYSIYKLAEEYNICPQAIHGIVKRVTWKHI